MSSRPALTLRVPLPPRELSPNARTHRLKRNTIAQAYRAQVGWLAREAVTAGGWQATHERFEVTVRVFWPPKVRQWDLDNVYAALKSAFDGMQDGGVWANDRRIVAFAVSSYPAPEGMDAARAVRIDVHPAWTEEVAA